MDKEYTAEEARVLAERLANGDLYVCTVESTGETDSYGNEITYHEEQYGILNDVVNILRKYADMKDDKRQDIQ